MNQKQLFDSVLTALDLGGFTPAQKGSYHYVARCPVHGGDDNDSLDLRYSEESDRTLLHCHSRNCGFREILDALGVDFTTDKEPIKSEDVRYVYTDEDGKPVFAQVRVGYGKNKRFYRMKYEGGEWVNGSPERSGLPLFQLPEVVKGVKDGELIWIVEGERDVLTLRSYGLVATTFAGGSGGWDKHYASYLRNADVVIIPDRDEPGKKMAQEVENGLRSVAKRVRVIDLPYDVQKSGGKDITDFFQDGHTLDELMRLLEASWRIDGVAYAYEWAEHADDLPELEDFGIPGLGPDYGDTGIGPGTFTVVAARLGVGKTAWLIDLLSRAAASEKLILVSTMDEPAMRLSRYIAASLTGDGRYALPNNAANRHKLKSASMCESLKQSRIILKYLKK
jgi:5S rRNA maturation endonuclease (ribonuclease M5)